MVRELGFEMKAQPCNRMKTEEELAKEEEERLQRLEVRVCVYRWGHRSTCGTPCGMQRGPQWMNPFRLC